MTRNVIEMVHTRADKDKMPSGLKITSKHGIILHDDTFIAGLESDSNDEDNNESDDEANYDKISPDAIADILHDTKSIQLPTQDAIQEDAIQEINDVNHEFQDVNNQEDDEDQKTDDDEESNESKSCSDKEEEEDSQQDLKEYPDLPSSPNTRISLYRVHIQLSQSLHNIIESYNSRHTE
jgi:hypothetical protein